MPRRTAAEAEATRQAVLHAARELFGSAGYAATSLDDVAHKAGVTRGAVYHHFADKQALFRAVFVATEAELDAYVGETALGGGDVVGMFRAGCRGMLAYMCRADYQMIAVTDAPAVLGVAEWHAIDAGIGMASLEGGLGALHEVGAIAAMPSHATVIALFGAMTELGLAVSRAEVTATDAEAAIWDLVTGR